MIKNNAVQIGEIEDRKSQRLQPVIYPNPGHGDFNLQFFVEKSTDVSFRVQSLNGTILVEKTIPNMSPGQHLIKSLFQQSLKESVYFITIKTNQEEITRKMIVE
ncbi:MAG: T9SS type A sorting domain-containing protein [Bacteroidetes bacterium]|nr:T9SS type A sorting domain-containing protein [Bacteroidota bacterium]